jgi:hypothetical protein
VQAVKPREGVERDRANLAPMTEHEASRTLVKSPPELWAECSDAASLARHLDSFGEIRITRLEPETAVAWEGETASGTVRLAASGWGTRVTLTARSTVLEEPSAPEAPPVAEALVAPEPPAVAEEPLVPEAQPTTQPLEPMTRASLLERLLRSVRRPPAMSFPISIPEPVAETESEPILETKPEPTQPSGDRVDDAQRALSAALDSLGQAHHRPFSRA